MPTIEQVQIKVQKILQKHGNLEITEDGEISIGWGSSHMFVRFIDFGDGDVIVRTYGIVALEIPVTDELCKDLILNRSLVFGSWEFFDMDTPNSKTATLVFRVDILGNDIDESELMMAIQSVGTVADGFDDEIVARFGGKRVEDVRE